MNRAQILAIGLSPTSFTVGAMAPTRYWTYVHQRVTGGEEEGRERPGLLEPYLVGLAAGDVASFGEAAGMLAEAVSFAIVSASALPVAFSPSFCWKSRSAA